MMDKDFRLRRISTVTQKPVLPNGVFVLLKEHPTIPDGPCEFLRFVANGEEVEVTKYVDSDLIWERYHGRAQARHIWRTALANGFRRDQ